jgi:chemotaxis methyl-accepting protein methylase
MRALLILKNGAPDNPIRIWSPACSTGKEVYFTAFAIPEIQVDL